MSKHDWKFWLVPIAAWGLYSCWHVGYQSGYADGHDTAWKMYQPFTPAGIASYDAQSDEPVDADLR